MTAVSARSFRFAYGSLLCLALTCGACGGGGGTDEPAPPPGEQPPLGITGRVYAENMDLGTLSEQEPNDARAQSHRLPPISARAYLQVRGQVDATDDPVDAFRFEVIQTQDIRLDVRWVGRGGPATVEAEVIDSRDGSQVAATTPGDSPRLVAFQAVAGVVYDVVLEAVDGRAAWEMGFAGGPSNQPLLASTTSSRPGVAIQPPVREAMACATTHVLVGLASDQAVEGLAARHGVRMGRRLAVGGVRVELPDAMSDRNEERIRAWCRELAKDDEVLWAEPDWLVKPLGLSDNAELPRQWNLHAVGAPDAWDTTRGAASVIVGVVDSGIVSHPDLEGRIAPGGYDFISDASIAGDGDGRDTDPTDTGAQELQSGRSMWHGTHVAAIVAGGAGAASGVAGVAPDARVMVLRALGRTGGLVGDVSDAILYAAGLHQTQEGLLLSTPLPIVNLSFGIAIDSRSLELACERAADAGVLLIGASGNDNGAVLYPAAYETVVAVG